LRKRLVKCCFWIRVLYRAEIWTLRKVDQKYLESFEMWYWKKMEKISWPDAVKNYKGLHRVNTDSDILHALNRKKANWIGHILRMNCLLEKIFKGRWKKG
jgi:hypothetical protein